MDIYMHVLPRVGTYWIDACNLFSPHPTAGPVEGGHARFIVVVVVVVEEWIAVDAAGCFPPPSLSKLTCVFI